MSERILTVALVVITVAYTLTAVTLHHPLAVSVSAFYDVGHINMYSVLTLSIHNPTNETYVVAVVVNAHRWLPLAVVVRPGVTTVNVTAPDPTVAIPIHSFYTVTLYLFNKTTAIGGTYGYAPSSRVYAVRNPNFTVLYNGSYGVAPYGWDIFYSDGNVSVEPHHIVVNGTALIEQVLSARLNVTPSVTYRGGNVTVLVIANTLVLYAVNTTIYGVTCP